MEKQKKLVILGSNKLSCQIVETAKAMGYYTIVIDWNPLEKAPAKRIAHEHCEISLADVEAVSAYCRQNQVDGILTGFTDSYLEYYAQICTQCGLPCYANQQLFHLFANKHLYKPVLKKYHIPTIEEYRIDSTDIRYPVLVKPSDNSGGRGISICHTPQELQDGYQRALSFSPSRNVLIEQYVVGREVTVFLYMRDGVTYLTGLGNRLIGVFQDGVIGLPVGYTFPSDITPYYEKEIFPALAGMLADLHADNGMMFLQCLLDAEGVLRIYDIGYRLTGSLEYIVLEKAFGLNPLKEMIKFAVGDPLQHLALPQCWRWQKVGLNISILARPGHIAVEEGVDAIRQCPLVIDAVTNHLMGDTIPPASKGTLDQIVLRVFALSDNPADVFAVADLIRNNYRLLDEEGKDMLLDIFPIDDLHLWEA